MPRGSCPPIRDFFTITVKLANLSNGKELGNELHTDDELLVQLKGLLALLSTHGEVLG